MASRYLLESGAPDGYLLEDGTGVLILEGDNEYEVEVFADNPVFVASMEEASGNLTDLIGGKVGTANGSPTYGVTGPIAGKTAVDLDGTDDYFAFADHADLDLGDGPLSIEYWIALDADPSSFYVILSKGNDAYASALGDNASAFNNAFTLGKANVATLSYSSTDATFAGAWTHVVLTKTAGTGAGRIKAFVNGTEGTTDHDTTTTLADNSVELRIGQENGSLFLNGKIAYVALYKSILSPTRVAAHYNAVGTGAQTVTLGLLDSGPALYAPTIQPDQFVTLGLLDASPAVYAPTLVGKNTLTLALLDASPALYAPTLLTKNLISLGLLDASPALYAPTIIIDQFVTLGLLDASPALYAPTLTASVTVTLGLLDSGSALYAPTLTTRNLISLGLLDAASALYAPTLTPKNLISLGLLDASPALYAPTLTPKNLISLGLLDAASALYAPTLVPQSITITLGLLDAGSALYAPTVLQNGGPQFVTLDLLDAASALYAPTLVQDQFVTLGLLDAGSALYAPVVSAVAYITLGLLDSGPALYAMSFSQTAGTVTVTLDLLDSGSALYAPSLVLTYDPAGTLAYNITLQEFWPQHRKSRDHRPL